MSRYPWITKTKGNWSNNKFYHTPAWRRLRATHIRQQPLCVHCEEQGKLTIATVVDHIVPIRIGGAALDITNLQSLCESCHNAKSAKQKNT